MYIIHEVSVFTLSNKHIIISVHVQSGNFGLRKNNFQLLNAFKAKLLGSRTVQFGRIRISVKQAFFTLLRAIVGIRVFTGSVVINDAFIIFI